MGSFGDYSLLIIRYLDVSRVQTLRPNYAVMKPFADLIHTVDDAKIRLLVSEVPSYLELAKDFVLNSADKCYQLEVFFKSNKKLLPNFYDLYQLVALFSPSNACSERLNAVFTELNFDESCLLETIESSTLMRYNHRKRTVRAPVNTESVGTMDVEIL